MAIITFITYGKKNNNFGKIGILFFGTGVDLFADIGDTLHRK